MFMKLFDYRYRKFMGQKKHSRSPEHFQMWEVRLGEMWEAEIRCQILEIQEVAREVYRIVRETSRSRNVMQMGQLTKMQTTR